MNDLTSQFHCHYYTTVYKYGNLDYTRIAIEFISPGFRRMWFYKGIE